jgi:molybdopterin-containing oxidoreductase family membrane subunit
VDYSILLGSFGWFFMWFLLFMRQMPVMAIAEIKEIVNPRWRTPPDITHDLDALVLDPSGTMGDD